MVSLKKSVLADLGLLLAAAIWGSGYVITKGAIVHLHPVVLLALRFSIAALILGPGLLLARKSLFHRWASGFLLGAILWATFAVQMIGLKSTTASNSGFITSLFVVFTPLLSFLFLREKLQPHKILAIAISTVGLWLITGGIRATGMGDLVTLVSALMFAIYFLVGGQLIKQKAEPLVLAFQQFLSATLLSVVTIVVFRIPFEMHMRETGFAVGYIAVFQTLVAFGLQLMAQKHTSALQVSLILALEAVFAALFAWTFGGETMIPTRALGGLLIFVATLAADSQIRDMIIGRFFGRQAAAIPKGC